MYLHYSINVCVKQFFTCFETKIKHILWLLTIILNIFIFCDEFFIVRFYFSLQIFVLKQQVTTKLLLFIFFSILPHISLYFFNNYLAWIKKFMTLGISIFFRHPPILGSKTDKSLISSLFLLPARYSQLFLAWEGSSDITVLSILHHLHRLDFWNNDFWNKLSFLNFSISTSPNLGNHCPFCIHTKKKYSFK